MPMYVTESGHEEFEDVRTRVGRNPPRAQSFWIVDMRQGVPQAVSTAGLPGIRDDPLAALRKAAVKEPLDGPRALQVEAGVHGLQGRAVSRTLTMMLNLVVH